jgi:plasmid stabilization system protein ParE
MRVEWHPFARADLAELITYIASDSPDAAYRVHDHIREQVKLLATYRKWAVQAVSEALANW